ncbi:MAG: site-2 protease family protein, partial [Bacteroidales bacterium]|nr:site-2 protease family protein [Bacteroidales bacterium]
ALLGIILAFMNIIPIPALDGGYILFILVEMITGKKPSDKFLGIANTIGFILLILLMVYALGLDFRRFFFK